MQLNFKGDVLDIDYIDRGEGDVIVLLEGWGTTAALYESVIAMLAGHFRVLAPDFPGFGRSTEPSFAYAAEDYADFVLAFLEKLNVKTASFVGHSHGGRVILELAVREKTSVALDKLVLIDAAGVVTKKKLSKRIRIRTYKILKRVFLTPPVQKLFPGALPALQKKFGSADYASSSATLRASMVKLVNTDYTPRLPLVGRPTLLIWGENDDATPLAQAKIMEKAIPDCGLVTVRGAGHFSFLEDPALVGRVLCSFFEC